MKNVATYLGIPYACMSLSELSSDDRVEGIDASDNDRDYTEGSQADQR
jgi:hypothetical protein